MIVNAWVNKHHYDHWKKYGVIRPASWCANVLGPNVIKIAEKDYDKNHVYDKGDGCYVYILSSFDINPGNCSRKHLRRLMYYEQIRQGGL